MVIINYGQAVVSGPLAELASGGNAGHGLRLHVARDDASIAAELGSLPGVRSVSREMGRSGGYALKIEGTPDVRERVAAQVVQRGWGLTELTPLTPTLEDIYLSLTGGAGAGEAA